MKLDWSRLLYRTLRRVGKAAFNTWLFKWLGLGAADSFLGTYLSAPGRSLRETPAMQLFKRKDSTFQPIAQQRFADDNNERRLQDWIKDNPHLIADDLLMIGKEVCTPDGDRIDLLALDREGNTVVIELKRGESPRAIMAQMNDYLVAVEKWDEDDLQRNANLIPSTRTENALLKKFQEHFKTPEPPPLNRRQWGVLMAEEIDDATVDRLGGSKYLMRALEFSYFRIEGDEYILIRDRSDSGALPQSSRAGRKHAAAVSADDRASNDGWSPEDITSFHAYYDKLESLLLRDVFRPEDGWRVKGRSSKYCYVMFSRWGPNYSEGIYFALSDEAPMVWVEDKVEKITKKSILTLNFDVPLDEFGTNWKLHEKSNRGQQGERPKLSPGDTILVYAEDESSKTCPRCFVGVSVRTKTHGIPLFKLLQQDEPQLRSRLGNEFELMEGGIPVSELVPDDNPQHVAQRLTAYRDMLGPYLDKMLSSPDRHSQLK